MKKIKVSEECNACGLCTVTEKYLQESSTGIAMPIPGKYIEDYDLTEVEDLVRNCPVGALTITEEFVKTSKADFISDAIAKLEAVCELDLPKRSDFPFIDREYSLSCSSPRGEYDYVYSSYDKAKRAAQNEFDRIAYSQIKVLALNLATKYKSRCLAPYYDIESQNIYDDKNKTIEELLKEIAGGYYAVLGKNLPSDFTEFKVYPDNDSSSLMRGLRKNEYFSDNLASEITSSVKSDNSLSSYDCYFDIDDTEKYEGQGMFGKSKYKTVYCYKNISKAVDELIKDIIRAARYVDCDEYACDKAQSLVHQYNYKMKKEIQKKIDILKRL